MTRHLHILQNKAFVFLFSIGIACGVVSCESDSSSSNQTSADSDTTVDPNFVPDTVEADAIYPPFQDSIIIEALQTAGICASEDSLIPPCDHTLFHAYKSGPEIPIHQSFILDVRMGAFPGVMTKQVMFLENMGGRWDVRNVYKGTLLEMISTAEGRYDLYIRYRHLGDAIIVSHAWSEEENRYVPRKVEEINGHFIKPSYQDSLNNLFLRDFKWGF